MDPQKLYRWPTLYSTYIRTSCKKRKASHSYIGSHFCHKHNAPCGSRQVRKREIWYPFHLEVLAAVMHALRQEVLPPSGVEYATSLKLTPSTLSATTRHESAARVLCNVVVARSSLLLIFEVREEPPPISTQADDERDRRVSVRRGTEAVEGEVEMDEQGEGFVNVGSFKVTSNISHISCLSNSFTQRESYHNVRNRDSAWR